MHKCRIVWEDNQRDTIISKDTKQIRLFLETYTVWLNLYLTILTQANSFFLSTCLQKDWDFANDRAVTLDTVGDKLLNASPCNQSTGHYRGVENRFSCKVFSESKAPCCSPAPCPFCRVCCFSEWRLIQTCTCSATEGSDGLLQTGKDDVIFITLALWRSRCANY